ncbi:hypothetical protein ACGFNW_34615, partial [Streptomyces olivaceus]
LAETVVEEPGAELVREDEQEREEDQAVEETAEDVVEAAQDLAETVVEEPGAELVREDEQEREEDQAVEETAEVEVEAAVDAAAEQQDANEGDERQQSSPSEPRPYADVPDAELSTTLAYYVEAADTAQEHAAAQEAKAAELHAALEPGGAVERSVAERAARIEAIQDLRAIAVELPAAQTADTRAREEALRIEARLAETARFGRPAVRGEDRVQLESRLAELRTEHERSAERITALRQRQADAERTAGPAAQHDEALASWERSGGSREAVLERTKEARQRRADTAGREAASARGEVGKLDAAAAAVRQEMNRRDAQPYEQRIAEEARRVQAQQEAARQQSQQQSAQQQGPDEQQSRGGTKR